MKNVDLKNKAVSFLTAEHRKLVVPEYKKSYSAKFVADQAGGYAGAIGHVAKQIVADMKANGIKCSYNNSTSPATFTLHA